VSADQTSADQTSTGEAPSEHADGASEDKRA